MLKKFEKINDFNDFFIGFFSRMKKYFHQSNPTMSIFLNNLKSILIDQTITLEDYAINQTRIRERHFSQAFKNAVLGFQTNSVFSFMNIVHNYEQQTR